MFLMTHWSWLPVVRRGGVLGLLLPVADRFADR
jgi:hypothetical protein